MSNPDVKKHDEKVSEEELNALLKQHEGSHYDEIEIEDMTFDEDNGVYYYNCPCGDLFQLSLEDIMNGECVAKCPSCSLTIKIIYNISDFNFEKEFETN